MGDQEQKLYYGFHFLSTLLKILNDDRHTDEYFSFYLDNLMHSITIWPRPSIRLIMGKHTNTPTGHLRDLNSWLGFILGTLGWMRCVCFFLPPLGFNVLGD